MAKSAGKRKGRKGTAGKKSDKKHGEEPAEKPAPTLTERVRACFGVSYVSALCIFYVVRVFGATSNTIPDCDEVYNYWEPTHQLLYGRGFQTWEYSPEFALRSYVYVGAHAVLAKVGQVVTLLSAENKVLAFYCIRFALAFVCAVSEASLYRSVAHLCGELVAGVAAMFMLTSAGMFHASSGACAAAACLPPCGARLTRVWPGCSFLAQHFRYVRGHVGLRVLVQTFMQVHGRSCALRHTTPTGAHKLTAPDAGRVYRCLGRLAVRGPGICPHGTAHDASSWGVRSRQVGSVLVCPYTGTRCHRACLPERHLLTIYLLPFLGTGWFCRCGPPLLPDVGGTCVEHCEVQCPGWRWRRRRRPVWR